MERTRLTPGSPVTRDNGTAEAGGWPDGVGLARCEGLAGQRERLLVGQVGAGLVGGVEGGLAQAGAGGRAGPRGVRARLVEGAADGARRAQQPGGELGLVALDRAVGAGVEDVGQ